MNFTFDPKIKRERLVGITNYVFKESIASIGSQGSQLTSSEMEIRNANRALFVLPHLKGVKKFETIMSELQTKGTIIAGKNQVGEVGVDLQEYITDPFLHRPRDTEQTTTDELLNRFQSGFQVAAVAARDKNYFGSIYKQAITGVQSAKAEVVDVKSADLLDETKIKTILLTVRKTIMNLINIKDRHGRGVTKKDLVFFMDPTLELAIRQSTLTGFFAENIVREAFTNGRIADGLFDGVKIVITNELDTPLATGKSGVHGVIMVMGSAVSPFLFQDMMNYDKTEGVNAYKCSLEFNAGAAVLLPNYISIIADATLSGLTAQARVSVDTVNLNDVVASELSVDRDTTDLTNPVNGFDASKSNDGKGK